MNVVITFLETTDRRWAHDRFVCLAGSCHAARAVSRVQALALRVIAERLEQREAPAEFLNLTFQAA
jgi:hypothetical protein